MKDKSKAANSVTSRPNLERFKYEVAQEMGLSFRNSQKKQKPAEETEPQGKKL